MRTEPLDVIYNEGVVRKVQQFFSPRRRAQSMSKEMSEFHLAGRFSIYQQSDMHTIWVRNCRILS